MFTWRRIKNPKHSDLGFVPMILTKYMKWLAVIWIFLLTVPAYGEDMRAAYKKAKADHENALAEAKASEERILKDRASLERKIKELKSEIKGLNQDINAMHSEYQRLKKEEIKLSQKKIEGEMDIKELIGTVRVVARDLETIVNQSFLTARFPEHKKMLNPILKKDRFPGLDDLKTITNLFFKLMKSSGEVVLYKGPFVNRSGIEQNGNILIIGGFTAAYTTGGETGFLNYSEGSHRLFALSALPSWTIRRNLKQYMKGKSEDVYLDLSKGAALRQITHKLTLAEQIKKGGIIVWPILLIGLVALILIVERGIFLKRVHTNTDRLMGKVNELASKGKWEECQELLLKERKKGPVHNILMNGLKNRHQERETLESVMQESILKELPRLERFLPALNTLAAIAPLLGLLGTVTGMISTFHVITLYGTGDPRMMSGGISEALVTTELGLAVAIPVMLMHAFLKRRVEHIVGDMEEKAVALVNIILKEKNK